MIWRLVEFAVVLWLVNSWLAKKLARAGGAPPSMPHPSRGNGATGVPGGTLVRCSICGQHVPIARAWRIAADGRVLCSEGCRPATDD